MANTPLFPTENKTHKQLHPGDEWKRPGPFSTVEWSPSDKLRRRANIALPMNYNYESHCFYLHSNNGKYGEIPDMEAFNDGDGLIGHGNVLDPFQTEWIADCNETTHPVSGKRVKKLHLVQLGVIRTFHTCDSQGFSDFFDEVLSQIPHDHFSLLSRMYYYTEVTIQMSSMLSKHSRHSGRTVIFAPVKADEYVYRKK